MAFFFIFMVALSSSIILQVGSYDCEEYRHHALQKCRGHYGRSLEICMHKRMKRSSCRSTENGSCGECNCNYCSSNSCSTRCNSCCKANIYEEEEVCETSYCCHKMCHKKCYTPSCRRTCRASCINSIDTKEIVVDKQTPKQQVSNITTVINLHNKINNTNLIDMPVKINTTNVNNLNLTAPTGITLDEVNQQGSQQENNCCELLVELCDPSDKTKCYREKQKYCGKECSSRHRKPQQRPQILPQLQNYPPVNIIPSNIPQVRPQQYYPFQQYPLIQPQRNLGLNSANVPSNIPTNYPINYFQYPQTYPQNYNYPSYAPQGILPQPLLPGCKQVQTYPFISCNENFYGNQQLGSPNQLNPLDTNAQNIPNIPTTSNIQNFPSNPANPNLSPYDISQYQISPYYYNPGVGQDLPGQPRTMLQDQTDNNPNNSNNDNNAIDNAIEDDDDDDEDDEDDV